MKTKVGDTPQILYKIGRPSYRIGIENSNPRILLGANDRAHIRGARMQLLRGEAKNPHPKKKNIKLLLLVVPICYTTTIKFYL